MRQYLDLVAEILARGEPTLDRTGVGTYRAIGRSMRFDLGAGFPIQTTKRIHFKSVVAELLWFLAGDVRVQTLKDQGVRIWNEWELPNGTIGPGYGKQWREWVCSDGRTIDQISDALKALRETPTSRRIIVSAWNPADIKNMALPPCHSLFQFFVREGKLDTILYQRSMDLFLGAPFNIASYALLAHLMAAYSDLYVGDLVVFAGDTHIYQNHTEQCREVLARDPRPLPKLLFEKKASIFDHKAEDFTLEGYDPHPTIKAKVAV